MASEKEATIIYIPNSGNKEKAPLFKAFAKQLNGLSAAHYQYQSAENTVYETQARRPLRQFVCGSNYSQRDFSTNAAQQLLMPREDSCAHRLFKKKKDATMQYTYNDEEKEWWEERPAIVEKTKNIEFKYKDFDRLKNEVEVYYDARYMNKTIAKDIVKLKCKSVLDGDVEFLNKLKEGGSDYEGYESTKISYEEYLEGLTPHIVYTLRTPVFFNSTGQPIPESRTREVDYILTDVTYMHGIRFQRHFPNREVSPDLRYYTNYNTFNTGRKKSNSPNCKLTQDPGKLKQLKQLKQKLRAALELQMKPGHIKKGIVVISMPNAFLSALSEGSKTRFKNLFIEAINDILTDPNMKKPLSGMRGIILAVHRKEDLEKAQGTFQKGSLNFPVLLTQGYDLLELTQDMKVFEMSGITTDRIPILIPAQGDPGPGGNQGLSPGSPNGMEELLARVSPIFVGLVNVVFNPTILKKIRSCFGEFVKKQPKQAHKARASNLLATNNPDNTTDRSGNNEHSRFYSRDADCYFDPKKFNQLSQSIATQFDLKEKPWIEVSEHSIALIKQLEFSFKNKGEAEKFSQESAKLDIKDPRTREQKKIIYDKREEKTYYVVVFNRPDCKKLDRYLMSPQKKVQPKVRLQNDPAKRESAIVAMQPKCHFEPSNFAILANFVVYQCALNEVPRIIESQDPNSGKWNLRFSFKKSDEAEKFSEAIKKIGIASFGDPSAQKKVRNEGDYHYIVLTYTNCKTLDSQFPNEIQSMKDGSYSNLNQEKLLRFEKVMLKKQLKDINKLSFLKTPQNQEKVRESVTKLIKAIDSLAKNPKQNQAELAHTLYLTRTLLTNNLDQAQLNKYINHAKKAQGKPSWAKKGVGILMMVLGFSLAVLSGLAMGVAAVPSFGLSVPILSAPLGAGVAMGVGGIGLFKHGCQHGESKAMSQIADTVAEAASLQSK